MATAIKEGVTRQMTIKTGQKMLEGITIVDMTSVVFGPYATQVLADLGADVIKIEAPGGDAYRYSARHAKTLGMAPGFMSINRGKRSIVLDLKQDAERKRMLEMLESADVFIHNVRGKAAEKLGLGFEAVKAVNPSIIYAHCVGFGQDGPYADLQAYDDVIQAASGTTSLLPRVDGEARPRYFPSLIADKVAGLHAVYAVQAAIIHQLRTGEGQYVEIPMFESFTHFMMLEHLGGHVFDPPVGDAGYARQVDPDRQPFATKDGHISLVIYTDQSWSTVLTMLGDPDFLEDERFSSPQARFKNAALIYRRIAELTTAFTTLELAEKCREAQIPAQPVRDLAEMRDEPHLNAVGFFQRREHPSEGGYLDMRQPVRFSSGEASSTRPPPRLNEHGDD